jgi:hypothetical protein
LQDPCLVGGQFRKRQMAMGIDVHSL